MEDDQSIISGQARRGIELGRSEKGTGEYAGTTVAGQERINISLTQNIYNYNFITGQTGSASSIQATGYQPLVAYIQEASKLPMLLGLLEEMEEVLDEPTEYEQVRASFLAELRTLEERKRARELYFGDVLAMIDIGVTYTEAEQLNKNSFSAFREALKSICQKLTSADLKELRKHFRESGINILKPLQTTADIEKILKGLFA